MAEEVMDVLSREYAERQLIIVQHDAEIWAHRRRLYAVPVAEATADATSGKNLIKRVLRFVPVVNLAAPVASTAVGAARSAMASKKLAATVSAADRLLRLRAAETTDLRLPLGHPLFDTVYVGHPARPAAYYPLADFHRRAFEHKFSEALRLVTSLGATAIKVSAVQGWGREFSTSLRVGLPTPDGANAKVTPRESHSREFLYAAELDGSTEPIIPPDLVWYPHEDSWQEIARQRIENGLRSFELQVTYQDDFSVTSELAAEVSRANLKIGGEFQRQQSTIWVINGTFAR